jgi:hypothetical protein
MNRKHSVVMAPDFQASNPYQQHLAAAIASKGWAVNFPLAKPRVLPLTRIILAQSPAIFHLHWPEHYYAHSKDNSIKWLRRMIYQELDLPCSGYLSNCKLVLTAHNLWPHKSADCPSSRRTIRKTASRAAAIIAHSESAADVISDSWEVSRDQISVIPHGDLSESLDELPEGAEARRQLGIEHQAPIFLMFGAVELYKGIEEVLLAWIHSKRAESIAIVGSCPDQTLNRKLTSLAAGRRNIILRIDQRVGDREMLWWHAVASGVVFNYSRILTSGAASLARSLGVPIIIRGDLASVDLLEPHATVFRFASTFDDLPKCLDAVALLPEARQIDEAWKNHVSWSNIAEKTILAYSNCLS